MQEIEMFDLLGRLKEKCNKHYKSFKKDETTHLTLKTRTNISTKRNL